MKVNNHLLKTIFESDSREAKVQLAYKHNVMASLFTKSGAFEKAEIHYRKAIAEAHAAGIAYSNVHVNLGNMHSQLKNYSEAKNSYRAAIESSPWRLIVQETQEHPDSVESDNDAFEKVYGSLNIPKALRDDLPEIFNSRAAYIDAHTNLGFCLLNLGDSIEAYDYLLKAFKLDQYNKEILVNIGNAMRQIGKRAEAIELAWKVILERHGELTQDFNYSISDFDFIKNSPINTSDNYCSPEDKSHISFVCVKWGTLYGADYVNKLFNGVKTYYLKPFKFYCLTENADGLMSEIEVLPLNSDFHTWWTKAHLFQGFEQLSKTKNVYIDLDVVIVGSLDFLADSNTEFALLRSDEIACESLNKDGYNSSVIIFQGERLNRIYSYLQKFHKSVTQVIFRFDYWLEMMAPKAEFLQDLCPGKICDYLAECQKEVKEGSSIVVFPRRPKPHDYPSDWVKDYWI